MSDDIDPEIAALIGGGVEEYKPTGKARPAGAAVPPDFATLFGDLGVSVEEKKSGEGSVDLTKKGFAPISKFEEDQAADYFSDPEYYKKVLNGEGDEAQKLHELLSKYLKTTDPKDRGVYRQQLIPAYWYLAAKIALRCASAQVLMPKRLMTRFGALLPNLLSPEIREVLGKVVFAKEIDEPVYYVDEWIRAIATGQINQSATDEAKPQRGDDRGRMTAILQKAQGKRDASEGIMKARAEERRSLESLLREKVEVVCKHESQPGLLHILAPYTDVQKKAMSEFSEIFKRMLGADKELLQSIGDFEKASEDLKSTTEKLQGLGRDAKADFQALAQEFETVRQMTKLCIGRQGNHFPILSKEYFHGGIRDIGSRENVVRLLAWVESIDCEAFCRPYKNTLNRIVPYVVILPTFGDNGICWEPFDRFNRATSRGRVAVPMYSKSLQNAIVCAVADLRWQVAKEKASYYWMEEGLTGNYYQWFTSK
ncbi:MAG: hypothetical protein JNG85_09410, partial [Spirochaetaceae bacterium]|nr:hypothetical protein [Spirochaetaceae bacterium]